MEPTMAPSSSSRRAKDTRIARSSSRARASAQLWSPGDWTYVTEGGKHAIFRYIGTDCDLSGHVLRVAKCDLAHASSCHTNNLSKEPSPRTYDAIESMEESSSQAFQRKIVQPLLGRSYLDVARVICLPASWCAKIYHDALASGSIPPSRLPSWNPRGKKVGAIDSGCRGLVKTTLLRDHTRLFQHPRKLSLASVSDDVYGKKSTTILSVEIKPKAGYITASPLVLPPHRCKYHRTRYSIQQELIHKGYVQKGWHRARGGQAGCRITGATGTRAFVPSAYSPLDIFSENIARMQKSLRDLSRNMQNNFRVWCNGKQIFGEYEAPSESDCQKILDDVFHPAPSDAREPPPDSKSTLLDAVTGTVAKILHREPLLSNVLLMQQLDVIDGDGAVMIYERLLHLCAGSNADAEKLLDDAATISRDGLLSRHQAATGDDHILWDLSPYTMPECDVLGVLLNEIMQFRTHLCTWIQERSSLDKEFVNVSHMKCIECVNGLTREACVYLLQNWLCSLALCDISFFVTFRVLTYSEHGMPVEELQSHENGGIALYSKHDDMLTNHTMAVHYEVKIVDCDPKPAKKLRERGQVESKFQLITV